MLMSRRAMGLLQPRSLSGCRHHGGELAQIIILHVWDARLHIALIAAWCSLHSFRLLSLFSAAIMPSLR